MKAKGQVCSQILEKQRKLASLESDYSTLAQVTFQCVFINPSTSDFLCKVMHGYLISTRTSNIMPNRFKFEGFDYDLYFS